MITIELNPQIKTGQPNIRLNWALAPDFQNETALKSYSSTKSYTFEDISGDFAEELRIAVEDSRIEPAPIPDVKPEDFEEIYCWFIS